MSETWPNPIQSTKHVKEAIDWVRHRTQDRVRLIIAVGVNGLAISIAKALHQLDARRTTSIATELPER